MNYQLMLVTALLSACTLFVKISFALTVEVINVFTDKPVANAMVYLKSEGKKAVSFTYAHGRYQFNTVGVKHNPHYNAYIPNIGKQLIYNLRGEKIAQIVSGKKLPPMSNGVFLVRYGNRTTRFLYLTNKSQLKQIVHTVIPYRKSLARASIAVDTIIVDHPDYFVKRIPVQEMMNTIRIHLWPYISFGDDIPATPYSAPIESANRTDNKSAGRAFWEATQIPVCWETAGFDAEKQQVIDAIDSTWAHYSPIHFVGWGDCTRGDPGIHILIDDDTPHVRAIGKSIDGVENGMRLNFTFNNWSESCQHYPMECIATIAVHEFGHALGFTHSQNRSDAPIDCQSLRQGSDPLVYLTDYDSNSVMNYCNPVWNNNGVLSVKDIAGLQRVYGSPNAPLVPTALIALPDKYPNIRFSWKSAGGDDYYRFRCAGNSWSYTPNSFCITPCTGLFELQQQWSGYRWSNSSSITVDPSIFQNHELLIAGFKVVNPEDAFRDNLIVNFNPDCQTGLFLNWVEKTGLGRNDLRRINKKIKYCENLHVQITEDDGVLGREKLVNTTFVPVQSALDIASAYQIMSTLPVGMPGGYSYKTFKGKHGNDDFEYIVYYYLD